MLRLQEKIYTNELLYRRIFDQARTPFDRLKEKIVLSQTTQSQLENLRKQTNPLALRKQIDDLITQLMSLPGFDQTDTVNIFQTMIKEANRSITLSSEPTNPVR